MWFFRKKQSWLNEGQDRLAVLPIPAIKPEQENHA